MKAQSCPGHGLWEQCDHGPAGGVGRGGNRAESSCSTEQANGPSVSGPLGYLVAIKKNKKKAIYILENMVIHLKHVDHAKLCIDI